MRKTAELIRITKPLLGKVLIIELLMYTSSRAYSNIGDRENDFIIDLFLAVDFNTITGPKWHKCVKRCCVYYSFFNYFISDVFWILDAKDQFTFRNKGLDSGTNLHNLFLFCVLKFLKMCINQSMKNIDNTWFLIP